MKNREIYARQKFIEVKTYLVIEYWHTIISCYNVTMKIFRAISGKEKLSLIEKNDILFPHKTCKVEEWILFPHTEDYETGKFFFFTIEDAFLYIKETKLANDKEVSILEMDIDESLVLPYLAYGIYCDGDFDFFGHPVPELLLPYSIVNEKIKSKNYNLLCFGKDAFCYSNNKYKFNMTFKTSKPKSFVNFGKILKELLSSRKNFEADQEEFIKCQNKFNDGFESFMDCQRQYNWKYSRSKIKTYCSTLPQPGSGE